MKKHTKKPHVPSLPRALDPERLAELRGGDGPIIPTWVSGQHNESFVRRARRGRR